MGSTRHVRREAERMTQTLAHRARATEHAELELLARRRRPRMACLYLAAAESALVTSHTFTIDGGLSR